MRRVLPWLAPAAAVAAFWPTLGVPHLRWLDEPSIVFNQNLAFGFEELKWMWTSSAAGQWQPLTRLSLALDRALFGADPRGARAVNLALHALNAGLVFALARRLLRTREEDRDWAALAAALLWALHPLRAETLGPAALRRDLLGVGAQADTGEYQGLASFSVSSRLAQAVHAPPFYALKTPWPEGLSPHYERSSSLEPRLFAASLVACAAAAGLAWALAARAPGAWRLVAAYALLLLPALGLVKAGRCLAADRWSYLPAVPLTMGAVAFLFRLPSAPARGAALAAAAACVLASRARAHAP